MPKKSGKPRRSQFEFIEMASLKKTKNVALQAGKHPRMTVRPSPFKAAAKT
jgi:hypothetical protein